MQATRQERPIMTNQQVSPEALRLADWLQNAVATYPQVIEDEPGGYCQEVDQVMDEAAAELRRLHAENERLAALVDAQQPAPSAAAAVSDEDEALDLLATLFDAWENGTPCYEEPESSDGFLGHAFRLDDEVFHRCADLLNRRRGKQPSPTPQAAAVEPDRADATNLARNTIKYPDLQITAKGVLCLAEAVLEMDKYIADFVNAAPQQEVQEPVGEVQHLHELNDSWLNKLSIGTKLYTAPQPAPAPLSNDVVKDATRWRMAALIGKEVMLHPEKRTHATVVKSYTDAIHSGSDLTGAVDAAIAAQGGKDAG